MTPSEFQTLAEQQAAGKATSGGHPLGPLVERCAGATVGYRMIAGLVFAVCVLVLGTAGWLEPDPSGLGTHRQLWPGHCPVPLLTSYPCPTCGMTTAFAHTVRGEFGRAFYAQPAGLMLCLATLVAAAVALDSVFTGRRWEVNWYRVSPTWPVIVLLGTVLAGWAFKVATVAWLA